MSKKLDFATQLQRQVTLIAQAADKGDDLVTVYFDRTYNSGGADEIVDADLTTLEITAAQLGNAITFFQNLNKLLNNEDPANADYDATLNAVRTDL